MIALIERNIYKKNSLINNEIDKTINSKVSVYHDINPLLYPLNDIGYADISLTDFGSYKKLKIEFNIHNNNEGNSYIGIDNLDNNRIETYSENDAVIPLVKINNVHDFNLSNIATYAQNCNTNTFLNNIRDITSSPLDKYRIDLVWFKPYIFISRDKLKSLINAMNAVLLIGNKAVRIHYWIKPNSILNKLNN